MTTLEHFIIIIMYVIDTSTKYVSVYMDKWYANVVWT